MSQLTNINGYIHIIHDYYIAQNPRQPEFFKLYLKYSEADGRPGFIHLETFSDFTKVEPYIKNRIRQASNRLGLDYL